MFDTTFEDTPHIDDGWVKIAVDIQGNISVLDACRLTVKPDNLSDYDLFLEEADNIGMHDIFGHIHVPLERGGVYEVKFKIDGSWDYYHIEYDYDIILDFDTAKRLC